MTAGQVEQSELEEMVRSALRGKAASQKGARVEEESNRIPDKVASQLEHVTKAQAERSSAPASELLSISNMIASSPGRGQRERPEAQEAQEAQEIDKGTTNEQPKERVDKIRDIVSRIVDRRIEEKLSRSNVEKEQDIPQKSTIDIKTEAERTFAIVAKKLVRVNCPECGHEQYIFSCSVYIRCEHCETALAITVSQDKRADHLRIQETIEILNRAGENTEQKIATANLKLIEAKERLENIAKVVTVLAGYTQKLLSQVGKINNALKSRGQMPTKKRIRAH